MRIKGKIALGIIGLVSAALLFVILVIIPRGKDISALERPEAELNEILSSRTETEENLARSIRFNGFALVYDSKNDAYYYSLVEGSRSAYHPKVEVEGERGDVSIAFPDAAIGERELSESSPVEAFLYNDTSYKRIKIYCTTLPLVSIECDADDIADEEYAEMKLRVFDNRMQATARLTVCDGTIHVRGQSSKGYPKKSYRLTLLDRSLGNNVRELDISLLGLRKDADLILYAAYNDQERIRNVFSSKLWYDACAGNNSFGVKNGVEYRFCELFMNGEYHGLYALGFPIDADVTGIAPGEYTYRKYTRDDDLTIDYLDYDKIKEHFEIKEGDVDAPDSEIWSPLADYYTRMQSAGGAGRRILDICDVPNAVDTFLFFNLVQGVDNVSDRATLSVDISMKKLNGRYVALYTPWDMDQTWGNMWSTKASNWVMPYKNGPELNCLMKINPVCLLMQSGDRDMIDTVKERYRELRSGEWSDGAISLLLDEYESEIFGSGAYLRDVERWPNSSRLEDPAKGLSEMRDFVMKRLEYSDEFIENITPASLSDENAD